MKSVKNIIFIVVAALIVVAEAAYLCTVYKEDRQQIATKNSRVEELTIQLEDLERRYQNMEETQKQLAIAKSQKEAMLNAVPSISGHQSEEMELLRYLNTNDFSEGSLATVAEDAAQNPAAVPVAENQIAITQHGYDVTFVTTYDNAQKFVDNINKAYQLINIDSYSMNNDVQKDEKKRAKFVKLFGEENVGSMVEAEIKFTLYSRTGDKEEEEVYNPDQSNHITVKHAFKRRDADTTETSASADNNNTSASGDAAQSTLSESQPSDRKLDENNTFRITVADTLTSGDTYQVSGPGQGDEGYIGAVSSKDAVIRININKDGYEASIETDGQPRQINVKCNITAPVIDITSTMRDIQEVMPNVKIYIYNYTDKVANVTMSGKMLNNITVFDEFDEIVTKGQTKGNVKLN